MRTNFDKQKAEVLDNLYRVKPGKKLNKGFLTDILGINRENWDATVQTAIKPIYLNIISYTGSLAMTQTGADVTFDPFSASLRRFMDGRSTRIAKDVNEETEKQLRASITQGIAAKEDIYQLSARVNDVFGVNSTTRAMRIARTESAKSQGIADVEAWVQSEVVTGKQWFTAEDERVCPFCGSLHLKVYGLEDNIFEKGDVQSVGKQTLKHDYDNVIAPPDHPNCRCVLLPVLVKV